MSSEQDIKTIVRNKYSEIALSQVPLDDGCCGAGSSCCTSAAGVNFSEDYSDVQGYLPQADLGLGCGMPTVGSEIQPGQTVLDLGSGAGNDAFVARSLVGKTGRVIGLDFSAEMVEKARRNAAQLGHDNVTFMLGDIEDIPLPDSSVDVVISNCVLNLVPDKARTYREIQRVLKPGGRFSISDVVLEGTLPEKLAQTAALYVGCVAGAMQSEAYLEVIREAGFPEVTVHSRKPVTLPVELWKEHFSEKDHQDFLMSQVGIYSLTMGAVKPC
jgi:ubiquinone/menaquinone biosynthesis C-methylase UbiE|nr:arsenite methyltransferase [Candidatus Krumholzibacteria bacterium]